MKKNLVVLLVVILTLTLFAACKDSGSGDNTPTQKPAEATATPEVTAAPTATPVPGPKTYYEYDFSDEEADEAPYLDGWTAIDIANEGKTKVRTEADNKYVLLSGFMNVTLDEYIEEGYTFSFSAKGVSATDFAGAFVRGSSQLTLPVSTNPNGSMYYEADDSGTKYTSTTGIGFWFKGTGSITVFVKTNDSTKAAGIGNLDATIACTYDASKWNDIKIADDFNGKIEISVNNELVAVIEYSEAGEYEVFPGEKFYQKATIKDAAGTVLGSTDNAFIYEYSEIAFATRAASINLDNISIKSIE